MKKLLRLFAILFHIALFAAGSLFVLYSRFQPISYAPASFAESNAILDNPFRGFFHMGGFLLSEEDPETMSARCRQLINADNRQLMMVQINLKNYADSNLSQNALQQLDLILSQIHASKKQVILRFLYDWDGKALETEPTSLSQIVTHMDQVADIVNTYADCVFILQSTFTGNNGEMTQTRFGSHEHNRFLMTHLSEVIDPSVFLAVRTPSHLRGVTQSKTPITSHTAFNGSLASRLGLYNDGMLGSVYDLGTYDDTSFAAGTAPEEKGTREEEIAFQDSLCQYVPNGGEVVIDNPYNDFDNSIKDLKRMHVSYLNRDHQIEVLEKWEASVYKGNDCFWGMNGLDYIEAHLGYRYVITNSDLTFDPFKSDKAVLTFAIQNNGFAPSYRKFDAEVTLRNTDTDVRITIPVEMDVRTLKADSSAVFTYLLDIRALLEGKYEIFFGLTDPYTGHAILFANDTAEENGMTPLGTLHILSTSQGTAWETFIKSLPTLFFD